MRSWWLTLATELGSVLFATIACASGVIAYAPDVHTVQSGDYYGSAYILIGVPNPGSPPSPNAGGTLFAKMPSATGCIDNNTTVILDMPTSPDPQSCFVRTTKLNIRDFGAKGDTRSGFTDGTIGAGSTSFCSASAGFTAADIGKHIYIQGAGPSFSPTIQSGNPNVGPHYQTLDTTILGLGGANCVNLAASATTATPWGSEPGPTINSPGTNYSPGDVLVLAGGSLFSTCAGSPTSSCAATVKVNLVGLVSTTIGTSGSGSIAPDGVCTLTGTGGTALGGQKYQVTATVTSGALDMSQPVTVVSKMNGFYTTTPSLTGDTVSGCGFPSGTQPTIKPVFGVEQITMLWNGTYTVLPSGTTQTVNSYTCAVSTCSGATFDPSGSRQMNVFSVGTDDTPALRAAIAAQNQVANATPTMNSHVCVYAPAGVYSVTPLNPANTNTGAFSRNGCIEGDGHLQTIFHLRPNVGGDLLAWYNAQGSGARPYNGNILLLNLDQAGPSCHGFAIEGDRSSNVDQNGLSFYGLNDYILCTDVEVDYLLGSALRCGDTLTSAPSDPTFCRESHFRDLHFTRAGDGTGYPVISFTSQNGSDGDNNLDLEDIDIYNPRGTGMLVTDAAGSGTQGTGRITSPWRG